MTTTYTGKLKPELAGGYYKSQMERPEENGQSLGKFIWKHQVFTERFEDQLDPYTIWNKSFIISFVADDFSNDATADK